METINISILFHIGCRKCKKLPLYTVESPLSELMATIKQPERNDDSVGDSTVACTTMDLLLVQRKRKDNNEKLYNMVYGGNSQHKHL